MENTHLNMSYPAKIEFFCTACVKNDQVKTDVYGDPIECKQCSNNRITAEFGYVNELTRDFVKVDNITPPKEGTYYVMLISDIELYDNILTDFAESTDMVRGARFMKDRFFFSTPLEDHIRVDHFFKALAWIPKQ